MNDLGDLRLFTRIVAAGSLSEAARRSNMSLTAVSRRLSFMEDRLKVRLIDRAPRKFEVTLEGQLLHRRAVRIVEQLETALAELDNASGAMRGRLRVSAPNEIGRRVIAPLCQRFTAEHRGIAIDLSFTDDQPSALEGDLDVAIVTELPTDGAVISRKLLTSRPVVCASPVYIEKRGRPERPEHLVDHECLRMRRGDRVSETWTLMSADGPREYTVGGVLTADCSGTIHQWVLAGGGIAVQPLWDVRGDLEAGTLVELLPGHACDNICLYAIHVSRRHIPPRIRQFVNLLVEHLSKLC
jgi:DNA-binding transcriptional LysR family regulator